MLVDGGTLKIGNISNTNAAYSIQVTLQNSGTLILGGATGNANFTLGSGTLILNGTVECNTLTINTGLNFSVSDASLTSLLVGSETGSVTLFTFQVASEESLLNLRESIEAGLASYSGSLYDLSDIEITITQPDGEGGLGSVSISGVQFIPEPTTATLSLLALAGLSLRRRRKA